MSANKLLVPALVGASTLIAGVGGYFLRAGFESTKQVAVLPGAVAEAEQRLPSQVDLLGSGIEPGAYFRNVQELVERYFYNEVQDQSSISHGALTFMFDEIANPGTRFYTPAAWRSIQRMYSGTPTGIGADLVIESTGAPEQRIPELRVVSALPGWHATKAGLKPGDEIAAVDGRWIMGGALLQDWQKVQKAYAAKKVTIEQVQTAYESFRERLDNALTPDEAVAKLLTSSELPVEIDFIRSGEFKKLKVQRNSLKSQPVFSDGTTVVIRAFGEDCADQLRKFLNGKSEITIDVRSNPGGDVNHVIKALELLVPAGEVGKYQKEPKAELLPIQLQEGASQKRKITLLVDAGTAREAELFVSALRDRAGALVKGGPTSGFGVSLERVSLKDGSGYTLLSSHLFDVSGRPLVRQSEGEAKSAFLHASSPLLQGGKA